LEAEAVTIEPDCPFQIVNAESEERYPGLHVQAVRICNDSDFGQAACLRFDSESNRIDNRA
jgi:hypothetical protein